MTVDETIAFLKELKTTLGESLRLSRSAAFITTGDFVDEGMSKVQLSRVERGKAGLKALDEALRIYRRLHPILSQHKQPTGLQDAINEIVKRNGYLIAVWVAHRVFITLQKKVGVKNYVLIHVYNYKMKMKTFEVKRRRYGAVEIPHRVLDYLKTQFNIERPTTRLAFYRMRSVLHKHKVIV
jgi:hypothetical protein